MLNTLVIYEGKYGTAERVAYNVGVIVGNTKILSIDKAPKEIKAFQNIVIVFSFRGYDTLSQTKVYLKEMQNEFQDKQIATIGVGLAQADLARYMPMISDIVDVKEELRYFVQGQLCVKTLSEEDYKALEVFTQKVKMPLQDMGKLSLREVAEVGSSLKWNLQVSTKPMEREQLKEEIEEFIKKHNMLALATGSGYEVRCSPVEYIYDEESFYIITEGGLKFSGLTQNNKISFGIYNAYEGMDKLGGLQVSAHAQMVPLHSATYMKIMRMKGIKIETLQKLPIDLYMIKLVPTLYEFLYSPLAKAGYDVKQIYIK